MLFPLVAQWWGFRLEDWRDPGAVGSANHCQLKLIGIVNSQDHIDPVYLHLLEQTPNVVVDNVQNICFVFLFPWFEYSCACSVSNTCPILTSMIKRVVFVKFKR